MPAGSVLASAFRTAVRKETAVPDEEMEQTAEAIATDAVDTAVAAEILHEDAVEKAVEADALYAAADDED